MVQGLEGGLRDLSDCGILLCWSIQDKKAIHVHLKAAGGPAYQAGCEGLGLLSKQVHARVKIVRVGCVQLKWWKQDKGDSRSNSHPKGKPLKKWGQGAWFIHLSAVQARFELGEGGRGSTDLLFFEMLKENLAGHQPGAFLSFFHLHLPLQNSCVLELCSGVLRDSAAQKTGGTSLCLGSLDEKYGLPQKVPRLISYGMMLVLGWWLVLEPWLWAVCA